VKSVRYLEAARDELLHEVAYFTSVSPQLGQRFDQAVQKAEALIAEFPEVGFPFKFGTRRVFPGKFKLSMVYAIRDAEVVVVAIAPFRRKPAYWRSRLRED